MASILAAHGIEHGVTSIQWMTLVWHGMAYHGIAWYIMAWHGRAWHGIVDNIP